MGQARRLRTFRCGRSIVDACPSQQLLGRCNAHAHTSSTTATGGHRGEGNDVDADHGGSGGQLGGLHAPAGGGRAAHGTLVCTCRVMCVPFLLQQPHRTILTIVSSRPTLADHGGRQRREGDADGRVLRGGLALRRPGTHSYACVISSQLWLGYPLISPPTHPSPCTHMHAQSNMQMSLSQAFNATKEIQAAVKMKGPPVRVLLLSPLPASPSSTYTHHCAPSVASKPLNLSRSPLP